MRRSIFPRSRYLWILLCAAVVNIAVISYLLPCDIVVATSCDDRLDGNCGRNNKAVSVSDQRLVDRQQSVTFIVREYEDFENDVSGTVTGLAQSHPKSTVLVIADDLPYPPLGLPPLDNIRLICLKGEPDRPMRDSRPEFFLDSRYVIVVPDGVGWGSNASVELMFTFFEDQKKLDSSVSVAAWAVNRSPVKCLQLNIDLRSWILTQSATKDTSNNICDALDGDRLVLLLETQTLLNLSFPFLRPLQRAIFVQNSLRKHRVVVDRSRYLFEEKVEPFKEDSHNRWKHEEKERNRWRQALGTLGLKLVRYSTGREEWYGCGKETVRCFGTVVDDMPDYIYRNRWTPPCCLRALRLTVRHVFRTLVDRGIRFWLEGGSLLGAARDGDIIPWDYDVDVGMYGVDVAMSPELRACRSEAFEDADGFVWEKATEGDFFRVQYSRTNRLHVDIFPFYSRNGTMTKDTWFKSHRQDVEFPEAFLLPMGKIGFAGVEAPAPNRVREFLELKFGHGVIENPRYPNAQEVILH